MASPVSRPHRDFHFLLSYWSGHYASFTPGVEGGIAGTWLMADDSAPQPDLDLRIKPAAGGQSREEGAYSAGAPELIAEVSHTTSSKDSGEKLRLYQSSGVQEYLTVRQQRKQITWRRLVRGKYAELAPDPRGIYRSRVFPGLWLDPEALWLGDLPGLAQTVQAGVATLDHARFLQALARRQQGA
jgi:Uma2 family endonuclease